MGEFSIKYSNAIMPYLFGVRGCIADFVAQAVIIKTVL